MLLIVLFPMLGVLIYIIARGDKMRAHEASIRREQDAAVRSYIRTPPAAPRLTLQSSKT